MKIEQLEKLRDELNKTVQTSFELLSPEEMKELNETTQQAIAKGTIKQRMQREAVIHRYCRDILNGDWIENPQTITITKNGCVIDGLHRIQAGLLSGQSVLFNVTRNWQVEKVFNVMDSGIQRSVNQILQMGGLSNAYKMAGIARSLTYIACGYLKETRYLSPQEIKRVLYAFDKPLKLILDIMQQTGSRPLAAEYLASMIFVYDFAPETVYSFAEALFSLKFDAGHPARALRLWMDKQAGRGRRMTLARGTLNALQAAVEKKSIQYLSDKLDGLTWARKVCVKKVEAIRSIVGA